MIQQNWWTTQLKTEGNPLQALQTLVKADIVIVGAGMAGIAAAAAFVNKGLKVVMLEKNIFGGSSTGKSAGFLTPDSELELWQLIRQFGKKKALKLWNAAEHGINLIAEHIKQHNIECDFEAQDSLFLGLGKKGGRDVMMELKAHKLLKLEQQIYSENTLDQVIGSTKYTKGILYKNTYVINALSYCQGMKKWLLENNIEIYESTEVMEVNGHIVKTGQGSVIADRIIFCADKLPSKITPLSKEIYPAQTFLAVSDPLHETLVKRMFPTGRYQCWDTDLIYTYFRLTSDNRILIGGSNKLTTFSSREVSSPLVITKVIAKFKEKFPYLNDLEFIEFWPGKIDTTRDLLPIVTIDKEREWIYFVMGCAGLPWASFCGDFVARNVLGESNKDSESFYKFFKPHRPTVFPSWLESIIGKQLSFSINSLWSKYYRKK